MPFPDTSQMKRSEHSGDLILGGSIGVNRVLLYFRDNAYRPARYEWNIFLVNLFTVFRNVYHKDLSEDQILRAMDVDVGLLTTYFDAYKEVKQPIVPYVLAFYVPTYDKIPEKLRRPVTTDSAKHKQEMYAKVRARLPQKLQILRDDATSKVCVAPVGRLMLPHKELLRLINDQFKPALGPVTLQVLLLSHCPIDLHMSAKIQYMSLIESNVGTVKAPNEFGSKLTKAVRVPFNTYTHRLLGDPVHLEPLVVRKEKAKILEIAEKHKWYIRSPVEILKDIVDNTSVTKDQLTDLILT